MYTTNDCNSPKSETSSVHSRNFEGSGEWTEHGSATNGRGDPRRADGFGSRLLSSAAYRQVGSGFLSDLRRSARFTDLDAFQSLTLGVKEEELDLLSCEGPKSCRCLALHRGQVSG